MVSNPWRPPARFRDASVSDFHDDAAVTHIVNPWLERVIDDASVRTEREHVPGSGPGLSKEVPDLQGLPGLVLTGAVGSGKTHLACGIYNVLAGNKPVRFASALQLVEQEKAEIDRYGADDRVSANFSKANAVVILDDVTSIRPTDFALDTLSKIVRIRYDEELPTVVTTHAGFRTIAETFGPAIASRLLEFGSLVKLGGQDRRRTQT